MPRKNPLEPATHDDGSVRVNHGRSSVAEFVKRPLPNDEEVKEFDDYLNEEEREEEIDESLSEIYQDEKGQVVDVRKLDIKKRRGFLYYFFSLVIFAGIFGTIGYGLYEYYFESGYDATAVELKLVIPAEIVAGEDISIEATYANRTMRPVTDLRLELAYPEGLVFLEAAPSPSAQSNIWDLGSLAPGATGRVKIKAQLMAREGYTAAVSGSLRYHPEGLTSEFKKETAVSLVVTDIGLDADLDHIPSVLVGEKNEAVFRYRASEVSYLGSFRLVIEPLENMEFKKSDTPLPEGVENPRPGVWEIGKLPTEETELKFDFVFLKKIADEQSVKMYLEKETPAGTFRLYEQALAFQVMKNDLNLTLIVNGSRDNQAVDFGDTLNFSLVYANKGETEFKDVIIMAVLESEVLDWSSLALATPGREEGNTVSWSKDEIPALAAIAQDQEGTIDLSVRVIPRDRAKAGQKLVVKSYGQFSLGGKPSAGSDTRSNTIENKVNTDLVFSEQVRYFNDDNIAVGTGPLPLRAGEATSFRFYWRIENTLHELNGARVELTLPEYAVWADKNQASVGNIGYDETARKAVWEIGRLPVTVTSVQAEFTVSITPRTEDRGKILVISSGTAATAVDSETGGGLKVVSKAKTTKLEDDEIAGGDGIVE